MACQGRGYQVRPSPAGMIERGGGGVREAVGWATSSAWGERDIRENAGMEAGRRNEDSGMNGTCHDQDAGMAAGRHDQHAGMEVGRSGQEAGIEGAQLDQDAVNSVSGPVAHSSLHSHWVHRAGT